MSIQQIQKYEKATNRVASGKLYQFAALLNVPIAYFFDGLDSLVTRPASSMAEGQDEFMDKDIMHEREVMTLVRSYNKIADVKVRKTILDLVKSLVV